MLWYMGLVLVLDTIPNTVLASRASFGHPKPSKSPLRTPQNIYEKFLKISFFKHKIEIFLFNIIYKT